MKLTKLTEQNGLALLGDSTGRIQAVRLDAMNPVAKSKIVTPPEIEQTEIVIALKTGSTICKAQEYRANGMRALAIFNHLKKTWFLVKTQAAANNPTRWTI